MCLTTSPNIVYKIQHSSKRVLEVLLLQVFWSLFDPPGVMPGATFSPGGRISRRSAASTLFVTLALVSWIVSVPASLAHHGSEGTVSVTILDPSGSIVPGAKLELIDLATSSTR